MEIYAKQNICLHLAVKLSFHSHQIIVALWMFRCVSVDKCYIFHDNCNIFDYMTVLNHMPRKSKTCSTVKNVILTMENATFAK